MRKIEKPGPNGEVADENPPAGGGVLRGKGVPALRAPAMALLNPGKMPDTVAPGDMVAESIAVDAAAATAEMGHVCRRRELKAEVPAAGGGMPSDGAVGMAPMEAPARPPPEFVGEPSVPVVLESSSPTEPPLELVTEPSVPVVFESSPPAGPPPEPPPEPVTEPSVPVVLESSSPTESPPEPVTEPNVRVLLEASWLTVRTTGAVVWLTVWMTGAVIWLAVWMTGAAAWLTVWVTGAVIWLAVWVTGAAACVTGAAAWVTGAAA
jgi:hypothetical protein